MATPEGVIEGYLCGRVKELGGIAYKFSSPARRNVPDRLCAFTTGLAAFVECKTPKGQLSKGQMLEFNRLVNLGHVVVVVHSKNEVDEFIEVVTTQLKRRQQ